MLAAAWLSVAVAAAWQLTTTSLGASDQRDHGVGVVVDDAVAVAPSLRRGQVMTEMPIIRRPGQVRTTESAGWRVTSTWTPGYDMFLRASSNPALRGSNARDGRSAPSTFANHRVNGCPCPWSVSGADRGVFGYTMTGSASFVDRNTWGTSSNRRWRGMTTTPYRVAGAGSPGSWDFSLLFRSELPPGLTQPAGSYRANMVLSFVPRS